MSTNTNFDRSSTGLSISFTAFQDHPFAHTLFGENFTPQANMSGYILYHGGEYEKEDHFLRDPDNYDISVEAARTFLLEEGLIDLIEVDNQDSEDDHTKEEYTNQINTASIEKLIEMVGTVFDYRQYNDMERHQMLSRFFSVKAIIVTVMGYSQGDIAHVIVPNEIAVNYKEQSTLVKILTNLVYDSPYYWNTTIKLGESEDIEFSCTDFDLDPYEWDSEKITDLIVKEAIERNQFISEALLRDQLSDLVPVAVCE